ncbi:hypothetical protein, partial [Francisella tularensis]|uniref:hypothetical protein n=1 Tax=Francisella tularensis TaxID=263 RepID=UPI0023AE3C2C|nr:hypothetical protein [Francisella tularensis subsp. holarctica]
KCGSKVNQKYGRKNDKQRYKCKIVTKHLVQRERPSKLLEILFYKYVFKHQTYADLALEYGKTKRWAYDQIHSYEVAK